MPPATGVPWLRRLAALLDHPRFSWIAAALAVALALPALGGGLAADDWFHRAQSTPDFELMPEGRGPLLDMFAFFPPEAEVRGEQIASGVLPWWTQSDIRGAFFRPVSALTHLADWRLVGDHPWLHHANSLVWLGLCVGAVGALFREWVGGRVAALATLYFAVDDAHAWPAAWIANRNALLAMTFGALAARAHLRQVRGIPGANWLVPLWLGLALGSAEAGAAAVVLLGILELGMGGGVRQRVARLWAPVVVAAAWAFAWAGLGYGIHGSGLYVDPVGDPFSFLVRVPERVGALSAALWLNVPVDFWVMLPGRLSVPLGLGLGTVAAAFVAFVARDAVRAHPRGREALAVALVALVPACAAFPMERVCTFAGMGAAVVLALATAPALTAERPRLRDRLVLFWHLPAAALLFSAKTLGMPALLGQLGAVADAVPSTPELPDQEVIMVGGLEIATAYIPIDRTFRKLPVPRGMLVLAPAATMAQATREDATTLRLDLPEGSFRHAIERLCRENPFTVGESVRTNAATVEVLAIDGEGHPTSIRARFARPLEDAGYLWLAPEDGTLTLAPWTPPGIGETVTVPPLFDLPE